MGSLSKFLSIAATVIQFGLISHAHAFDVPSELKSVIFGEMDFRSLSNYWMTSKVAQEEIKAAGIQLPSFECVSDPADEQIREYRQVFLGFRKSKQDLNRCLSLPSVQKAEILEIVANHKLDTDQSTLPTSLNDIEASLQGLKRVRTLILHRTIWNDEDLEKVLSFFPKLDQIDFKFATKLTSKSLVRVVTKFPQLRGLSISTDLLTSLEDLRVLQGLASLSHFQIASPWRGPYDSDSHLLEKVFEQISESLVSLDFKGTLKISPKDFSKIRKFRSLEKLSVQAEGIPPEVFVETLSHLKKLRSLTIRGCDETLSPNHLSEVTRNLPELRKLTVKLCKSVTKQNGLLGIASDLSQVTDLYVKENKYQAFSSDGLVKFIRMLPGLVRLSITS